MNRRPVETRLAQRAGDGWLPAEIVRELMAEGKRSLDELLLALVPIASSSAGPAISGFRVGAAALGASGAMYLGANLELPHCALYQTVHAEQAAVVNAAVHGESGLTSLAVSAPPCGHCRQFLYELVNASQLTILLAGGTRAELAAYLPDAFGPANLGITGGLLSGQEHSLEWVTPPDSPVDVAETTRQAAEASYAPYSKALAALSLTTRDGRTFTGPYLENAAFNPSISPLQAAVVSLTLAGHGLEEVSLALVVQLQDSPIDHASAARSVLARVAPQVSVEVRLVRAGS